MDGLLTVTNLLTQARRNDRRRSIRFSAGEFALTEFLSGYGIRGLDFSAIFYNLDRLA